MKRIISALLVLLAKTVPIEDIVPITNGARVYGVFDMLFNSIIYSCGNPLVSLFWIYSMAYVVSRFKWLGGKILYSLGVVLMMVSITGSSASTMIIYQKIGLYDNLYLNIIILSLNI